MTLKLVSGIDRTARAVIVDGHSERPMPFLAQIDEELVLVSAGAGRLDLTPYPAPAQQTWTIERGANGTIAAGHDAGAAVTPVAMHVAALIDPASATAHADLVASLVAAGIMAAPVATTLAFAVQPTDADTGAAISPAVTVSVLDQAGGILATDDVTAVTVALTTPGGAVLGGTTTVAAVSGVATFDDLEVDTAATYTLTATAAGLASDESDAFDVAAP